MHPPAASTAQFLRAAFDPAAFFATLEAPPHGGTTFGGLGAVAIASWQLQPSHHWIHRWRVYPSHQPSLVALAPHWVNLGRNSNFSASRRKFPRSTTTKNRISSCSTISYRDGSCPSRALTCRSTIIGAARLRLADVSSNSSSSLSYRSGSCPLWAVPYTNTTLGAAGLRLAKACSNGSSSLSYSGGYCPSWVFFLQQ